MIRLYTPNGDFVTELHDSLYRNGKPIRHKAIIYQGKEYRQHQPQRSGVDDNVYYEVRGITWGEIGDRPKMSKMSNDERDKFVANEIKSGRCPFGELQEGQTIAHCPLGFPGCGCADEIMENPYLAEWREQVK